MDTYRVSPHIHSECEEIWTRMETLFMDCTSDHFYVILISLYGKFTVTSWLNDCEDIKLLVPTHDSVYIYIFIPNPSLNMCLLFLIQTCPLDKKYVSSLLHFTFENILKYTTLYLSTFLTINVYFFFLY